MGMKKTASLLCVFVLLISLLTGCSLSSITPRPRLFGIKGDITCKFHASANAKVDKPVEITDIEFDKDMFIKLYNEYKSYDPGYMNHHLDKFDLKLDPKTQNEEWKRVNDTEVWVYAIYEDGQSSVRLYRHESKWYFFVLNKGGAAKPEEQGSYYKEISKEMDEYWTPILNKVLQA